MTKDLNIESGGVILGNPPLLPEKKDSHFKKMWRIGGWRLYLTHNFRLKNSQTRDQNRNHSGILTVKREKWNECEGHCQICGNKLKSFNASQIHHILAWWRVPQFECDKRNVLLLCTECHQKIHCDPFIQTRMIEQKCRELGIKVSDYYDNGEGGAPCQK